MSIDKFSGVGFPSPARDFQYLKFNLHSFLVKKEASTFFMKMKGDSMVDFGIFDKDLLVIDRSILPKDNMVVVVYNGYFLVRRLVKVKQHLFLYSNKENYQKVVLGDDLQIWGVVIGVVRKTI